jgi:hypothetical protein
LRALDACPCIRGLLSPGHGAIGYHYGPGGSFALSLGFICRDGNNYGHRYAWKHPNAASRRDYHRYRYSHPYSHRYGGRRHGYTTPDTYRRAASAHQFVERL